MKLNKKYMGGGINKKNKMMYKKGGLSEAQSREMDKDKDGDIDSKDLDMLRKAMDGMKIMYGHGGKNEYKHGGKNEYKHGGKNEYGHGGKNEYGHGGKNKMMYEEGGMGDKDKMMYEEGGMGDKDPVENSKEIQRLENRLEAIERQMAQFSGQGMENSEMKKSLMEKRKMIIERLKKLNAKMEEGGMTDKLPKFMD
jgi:hypothetical protein